MEDQKDHFQQQMSPPPDYQEAILPAWAFSNIVQHISQLIKGQLNYIEHPGQLIGLSLSYTLEDGQTYKLEFGTVEDSESPEADMPLSDDFLIYLYQSINDLIKEYSSYSGKISTELDLSITGSHFRVTVTCRQVGVSECSNSPNHVGTQMYCMRVNHGAWRCLHGRC
jgi:hypothetical protein